MEHNEETEEATNQVVELLEEWGSQSKFIWFRELHRITDIDKGLLRNIINELKKLKKKLLKTNSIEEQEKIIKQIDSTAKKMENNQKQSVKVTKSRLKERKKKSKR